ncbi:unnamed protein product [Lepeophtheirus salmonis]|uniref:(salmon louse) hypothetical protein n=1 Tax=Lepeophtheirus salmonis TaxID=72036 RepID=A0A7R8CYH0_LEPSM|nr:unnamed protein product [Lepeophtheirus salmonis]CAF2941435.1 unnamed protein product [Lepeophtheirus salmonis]
MKNYLFLLMVGLSGVYGEKRHHRHRGKEVFDELCVGQGTASFLNLDPRYSYNIAGIYSPKNWIHAGRKSTVELFCRVCGVADNCQYTVRWSKNGETLSHKKSSRVHAHIVSKSKHLYGLKIQNFRSKDYGLYSCTYYTSTGDELQTQIEVSGIAHPALLEPPVFNSPNSVTLNWKVNCSTPIINYELEFRDLTREGEEGPWIIMNIPAQNKKVFDKSQSYTLNGLLHGTTYQARIRSRNVYGISKFSPILKFDTEKDTSSINSRTQNDSTEEEILFKRSEQQRNHIIPQNGQIHPDGEPLKNKGNSRICCVFEGIKNFLSSTFLSSQCSTRIPAFFI